MSWRLLNEQQSDIYSNLAIDEAIAKTDLGSENAMNTIRFWWSPRAVVIGRFQCVHKEVNLDYCKENDISIARRFTGGGAVFHDLGNLNFSLRLHQSHNYVPRGLKELYEVFIGKIAESLNNLGIPARFDPVGSSIRIRSRKISGTAGWIKHGVSFIHGTLLINANLQMLQNSLTPPDHQDIFIRDRTRIRCIESKRDVVTNIDSEVENCPSYDVLKESIIKSLEELSGTTALNGFLSQAEINAAQALYDSQYSLPSWNLGFPAGSTPQ
jgi:lipoate-protein ligase A